MKLRLPETQEERGKDQENLGLSKDTAAKENVYGMELPLSVCSPFNAFENGYCKIPLNAGTTR